MIHRERVADDVYTFQSDVYAQVNAGAVIGQDWAVVIDTLAFPEETLAIREFIEYAQTLPGVWWATREEIADYYVQNHAQHIPVQSS